MYAITPADHTSHSHPYFFLRVMISGWPREEGGERRAEDATMMTAEHPPDGAPRTAM